MESNREKTSYRQFQYCSFCRINHKKGKKHLYSTKHRTIIHNILDKFRKKMGEATATLSAPEVESLGKTDTKQNFWCYYCVAEIARHQTLDVCLLKYGSMLEHIASEEHTKKTADFFRAHRVDESVRGRDMHCLPVDKLNAFKMLTVHAVRRFEEREKHQNQMIAKKLREQETKRRNISQSEDWKTVRQQQEFSEAGKLSRVSGYPDLSQSEGVSTLSARGAGMTFIGPQDFIEEEGNVHTGGLPPWLQDNPEGQDRDREIGPTLKDYQRHVANEQKKKLPACRVGASFDRSSAQSDTWLPSFGQVWNSGRRLNSKKYFEKETKSLTFLGKRAKSESLQEANSGKRTDTRDYVGQTSQVFHTKLPYKSKRQRSHDTLTNGQEVNTPQTELHFTTNNGGVGQLAFSAQGTTVENVHNNINNEGKTMSSVGVHLPSRYHSFKASRNSDDHRHEGFDRSTNLLRYPSKQDYSDMERGFPPQGQGHHDRFPPQGQGHHDRFPTQGQGHHDSFPTQGQGHHDRLPGGQNAMIGSPHQNYRKDSEQSSHLSNQFKQDIKRQCSGQAYKRKKGDNSVLPVTISRCNDALRTDFISTPLLDKKK